MKNLTAAILLALPILVVSPTVMAASSDAVAKLLMFNLKKAQIQLTIMGK